MWRKGSRLLIRRLYLQNICNKCKIYLYPAMDGHPSKTTENRGCRRFESGHFRGLPGDVAQLVEHQSGPSALRNFVKKTTYIRAIGIHPSIRFESDFDYGISEYQLSRMIDAARLWRIILLLNQGHSICRFESGRRKVKPAMWPKWERRCDDNDSLLTGRYCFL